jgi:hypothetical protein
MGLMSLPLQQDWEGLYHCTSLCWGARSARPARPSRCLGFSEGWTTWSLTVPLSPGLLETTVQKVARVKAPNKSLPSAVYCIEDKM